MLPPSIAFFGVVTLFYLFSHIDIPGKRYPLFLIMFASVLWLLASITAHGLARFVNSARYSGPGSVMLSKDFWYAYISAGFSAGVGFKKFVELEPEIAEKTKQDRAMPRII